MLWDTLFSMKLLIYFLLLAIQAVALERTGVEFKIFQFPANWKSRESMGMRMTGRSFLKTMRSAWEQLKDTVNNTRRSIERILMSR
jgi:hypothetical protein